jgi:tetratricopeptide (TPR) repeat protein
MSKGRSSLTLDVVATLLLTVSVTMLTDFTHRMLSADPDSLGILSIAAQAAATVAATSAFTQAGWSWLKELLHHFGRKIDHQSAWRFGLSLSLAAIVIPAWCFVPARLANYYNTRGMQESQGAPEDALLDYQRAIALNPALHEPYANLGGLMEDSYQYDQAAKEYQQAIMVDIADPTPYDNLSRVVLLKGDPLTGLRIAEAGLKLQPNGEALLKNKAWAELNLGFYAQSVTDASKSDSAAGECIMGKAYTKLGKQAEARQAWSNFEKMNATATASDPFVEPDCALLAETPDEKN